MNKFPRVTFVMPAYNAGLYIRDAIGSIQAQTVTDWNLVIVDDGSTDDTLTVAKSCAEKDSRISVHQMESPSGSAYQPRKRAIMLATTEYVSPLDADDWIEPTYLEQLLKKTNGGRTDVVYPTMHRGDTGKTRLTPLDDSLYQNVYKGKDSVWLTLDEWRINCNGGLIKKQCYLDTYDRFGSDISYSCADELLTRQLLLTSETVAFSHAKYYYRPNPDSITRKRSLKLFDFLINDMELVEFAKNNFGEESKEYVLAQRQNFHGLFTALRFLNSYTFDADEKEQAWKMIKASGEKVDAALLKQKVSPRFMALYKIGLPAARLCLKVIDPVMAALKIGNYKGKRVP